MAKRLTYERKWRREQTQQIGEADDAATRLSAIRRQVRALIQRECPDLPAAEVERRLQRRMDRGLRWT
jgi:hypothetical protein